MLPCLTGMLQRDFCALFSDKLAFLLNFYASKVGSEYGSV
jgi:hypothetical protein